MVGFLCNWISWGWGCGRYKIQIFDWESKMHDLVEAAPSTAHILALVLSCESANYLYT